MSAYEMMLDASDGVLDGNIDSWMHEYKGNLMGDKRWA